MTTAPVAPSPAAPSLPADAVRARRRPPARVTALAVAAGVAAAVIALGISTRRMLRDAASAALAASPLWTLVAAAAVAASFLASAVAIVTVSGVRGSYRQSAAVEVAGSFCNRFMPGTLGGTLLRIRYLRCTGLDLDRALSAAAILSIGSGISQAAGLGFAVLAADRSSLTGPRVPVDMNSVVAVSGAALVVLGSSWALSRWRYISARRQRWLEHGRCVVVDLCALARNRRVLMRVIAGPAGSSFARAIAFWAAAHAVGLNLGLTTAAMVYFAGMAVAGAAPVPGGLGPAEITLTVGLTATGIPSAPALAAVLVFRLISFWLPSLAGACALLWLRRGGALSTAGEASAVSRPTIIRRRSNRFGALQKGLLTGVAAVAAALISSGVAYATPAATESSAGTNIPTISQLGRTPPSSAELKAKISRPTRG